MFDELPFKVETAEYTGAGIFDQIDVVVMGTYKRN